MTISTLAVPPAILAVTDDRFEFRQAVDDESASRLIGGSATVAVRLSSGRRDAALTYLYVYDGICFWDDDWPLAARGASLGDFLEPYNGQPEHQSSSRSTGSCSRSSGSTRTRRGGSPAFWRCSRSRSRSTSILRPKVGPLHRQCRCECTSCGSRGTGFVATHRQPLPRRQQVAIVCAWLLMSPTTVRTTGLRRDRIGRHASLSVRGGLARVIAGCGVLRRMCTSRVCAVGSRCVGAVGLVARLVRWCFGERGHASGPVGPTHRERDGRCERSTACRTSFDALGVRQSTLGHRSSLLAFVVHLGWRLRAGLSADRRTRSPGPRRWPVWWLGLSYSAAAYSSTPTRAVRARGRRVHRACYRSRRCR